MSYNWRNIRQLDSGSYIGDWYFNDDLLLANRLMVQKTLNSSKIDSVSLIIEAIEGGIEITENGLSMMSAFTGNTSNIRNFLYQEGSGKLIEGAKPRWNVWGKKTPGAFYVSNGSFSDGLSSTCKQLFYSLKTLNSAIPAQGTARGSASLSSFSLPISANEFEFYEHNAPSLLPVLVPKTYLATNSLQVLINFGNSKHVCAFINELLGEPSSTNWKVGVSFRQANNTIYPVNKPNIVIGNDYTILGDSYAVIVDQVISENSEGYDAGYVINVNPGAVTTTPPAILYATPILLKETDAPVTANLIIPSKEITGVYPYSIQHSNVSNAELLVSVVALDENDQPTTDSRFVRSARIIFSKTGTGELPSATVTGSIAYSRSETSPPQAGFQYPEGNSFSAQVGGSLAPRSITIQVLPDDDTIQLDGYISVRNLYSSSSQLDVNVGGNSPLGNP